MVWGTPGAGQADWLPPPCVSELGTPESGVGADATCCPLGSEGSLAGERMFLALRKPASLLGAGGW